MAIIYIDPINGLDANSGADWANAKQTFNTGASGASYGDTIKIAKSPDPVSIGCDATWTNKNKTVTLASAQTLNIDRCETSWTAKTGIITVLNATPTAGGSGYTANDILTITTGGTLGQAKVLTVDGGGAVLTVALEAGGSGYTTGTGKITTGGTGDGACTVNITTIATATATRNGTTASAGREGSYYMICNTPNVKNTLLSYFGTGALDLSSYQKISFCVGFSGGLPPTGSLYLALCSDTAGTTIVDKFPIVAPVSTNGTAQYPMVMIREGGGNLGANIQSIALYTDTVAPSPTTDMRIDNVIACTTDGLNHRHLISKNSTANAGAELWHAIRSINGVTLVIDSGGQSGATTGQGYWGTTETVATYMRLGTPNEIANASSALSLPANNLTINGGWNTSSDTVDGETIFDGFSSYGYGIGSTTTNRTNITFTNLSFFRYTHAIFGVSGNASGWNVSGHDIANCSYAISVGSSTACWDWTIDYYGIHHLGAYGIAGNICRGDFRIRQCVGIIGQGFNEGNGSTSAPTVGTCYIHDSEFSYNTGGGLSLGYRGSLIHRLTNIVTKDNTGNGIFIYKTSAKPFYINNWVSSGNSTAGLNGESNSLLDIFLNNCVISDTTPIAGVTMVTDTYALRQTNKNQDTALHSATNQNWTMLTTATDRAGGTGIMWKYTSLNSTPVQYPHEETIAKFAVAGSGEVTVTVWAKKDHATGITAKFIIRGGQILGVPDDVIVTKSDVADTWEELTLQFTPTQAGVVELIMRYYYSGVNAKSVFIDAITVTQA